MKYSSQELESKVHCVQEKETMFTFQGKEYPPRVTRGTDGVYRWAGHADHEQKGEVVRIVMGVIGGICLLILAMFVYLYFTQGSKDMLGVVLLSCFAPLAIAGLICWVYYRIADDITQPYDLTEEYVRYAGTGKYDYYYHFKSLKKITICEQRNMIKVKGLISSAPVFVPHEDFRFVQDYILRRLPDTAKIVYR